MEKRLYLDHASGTFINPEIISDYQQFERDYGSNPSAVHTEGRAARDKLETARASVASLIGANADSIIFTSGGTEADNLGLLGAARALGGYKNEILIGKTEHDAIRNCIPELLARGHAVIDIPCDRNGVITPELLKSVMADRTGLVCVQSANHETGAVQPVRELCRVAHDKGALFMTDAVQMIRYLKSDVLETDVDILTLSGHKIGAPEGSGALYVRPGTPVKPVLFGGGQEKGIRPGTQNVSVCYGLGLACDYLSTNGDKDNRKVLTLRDLLKTRLEKIPDVRMHMAAQTLPGHLNVSFMGVEGEVMQAMMDRRGIAISTGASCRSNSGKPSPVLAAMGVDAWENRCAVRISLGPELSEEDMIRVSEAFRDAAERYRKAR